MRKIKHIALLSATLGGFLDGAAAAEEKPWLIMADWQSRAADSISHSGGEVGTYGRSRTGLEAIWKRADAAVDLEWYRYEQKFTGLAANSDRRYGDTTDLILTGFRQWDHGERYAAQLIYAVEFAAESSLALSEGFRWGLGGAVRWRPDPELDLALGLVVQHRFEMAPLPVPRSSTRCGAGSGSNSKAHSTRISVSGRGSSTRLSTCRLRPKNSLTPVM